MLMDMLEKAGFKIYEKIEQNIEKEFVVHHWSYPSQQNLTNYQIHG